VKFLRNASDSPPVQTNWTTPAGMESVNNKKGNETAMTKSLKNTTQKQTTSREFEKSFFFFLNCSEIFL
jgi:hypothetical protein